MNASTDHATDAADASEHTTHAAMARSIRVQARGPGRRPSATAATSAPACNASSLGTKNRSSSNALKVTTPMAAATAASPSAASTAVVAAGPSGGASEPVRASSIGRNVARDRKSTRLNSSHT